MTVKWSAVLRVTACVISFAACAVLISQSRLTGSGPSHSSLKASRSENLAEHGDTVDSSGRCPGLQQELQHLGINTSPHKHSRTLLQLAMCKPTFNRGSEEVRALYRAKLDSVDSSLNNGESPFPGKAAVNQTSAAGCQTSSTPSTFVNSGGGDVGTYSSINEAFSGGMHSSSHGPELESFIESSLRWLAASSGILACNHTINHPSAFTQQDTPGHYAIAINLHNSAEQLPNMIFQLLQLIVWLPHASLFLSIYDSGSTDATSEQLQLLQMLLLPLGVPSKIVSNGELRRGATEPRIMYLAAVRNKALEPILAAARDHTFTAEYVIFINDIFFCYADTLRLMQYKQDMVCGMDFHTSVPVSSFAQRSDLHVGGPTRQPQSLQARSKKRTLASRPQPPPTSRDVRDLPVTHSSSASSHKPPVAAVLGSTQEAGIEVSQQRASLRGSPPAASAERSKSKTSVVGSTVRTPAKLRKEAKARKPRGITDDSHKPRHQGSRTAAAAKSKNKLAGSEASAAVQLAPHELTPGLTAGDAKEIDIALWMSLFTQKQNAAETETIARHEPNQVSGSSSNSNSSRSEISSGNSGSSSGSSNSSRSELSSSGSSGGGSSSSKSSNKSHSSRTATQRQLSQNSTQDIPVPVNVLTLPVVLCNGEPSLTELSPPDVEQVSVHRGDSEPGMLLLPSTLGSEASSGGGPAERIGAARRLAHKSIDHTFIDDRLRLLFYDKWVTRDQEGGLLTNFSPYSTHNLTAERLFKGLPVPVHCCWNGMVVLSMKPFYAGLRFRSHMEGECAASECSLLCDDMHRLGYTKRVMDPGVRVAYAKAQVSRLFTHQVEGISNLMTWPGVRSLLPELLNAKLARTPAHHNVTCCDLLPSKASVDFRHNCHSMDIMNANFTSVFLSKA